MIRDTSLTTIDQFLPMIADLPLRIVEKSETSLALMPTSVLDDTDRDHLLHALEIVAGKRGLRVRRGVTVWRVKGFLRGAAK